MLSVFFSLYSASNLANENFLYMLEKKLEENSMQQLQLVQKNKESTLRPFETDGCSGSLSDTWRMLAQAFSGLTTRYGDQPPWEDCCVEHDRVYWPGTVRNGFEERLAADKALQECVRQRGRELAPRLSSKHSVSENSVVQLFDTSANLMYHAVRIGGKACTVLPWRWGYGWPECPLF